MATLQNAEDSSGALEQSETPTTVTIQSQPGITNELDTTGGSDTSSECEVSSEADKSYVSETSVEIVISNPSKESEQTEFMPSNDSKAMGKLQLTTDAVASAEIGGNVQLSTETESSTGAEESQQLTESEVPSEVEDSMRRVGSSMIETPNYSKTSGESEGPNESEQANTLKPTEDELSSKSNDSSESNLLENTADIEAFVEIESAGDSQSSDGPRATVEAEIIGPIEPPGDTPVANESENLNITENNDSSETSNDTNTSNEPDNANTDIINRSETLNEDKRKEETKDDDKQKAGEKEMEEDNEDFSHLFDYARTADMKAIVGLGADEKTYNLHQQYICAESGFFKAAIMGGFREGASRTVNLPEMSPYAFEILAQCSYGGRYKIPDPYDEDEIVAIYESADFLQMPTIKQKILEAVYAGFTKDFSNHPNHKIKSPLSLMRRLCVSSNVSDWIMLRKMMLQAFSVELIQPDLLVNFARSNEDETLFVAVALDAFQESLVQSVCIVPQVRFLNPDTTKCGTCCNTLGNMYLVMENHLK